MNKKMKWLSTNHMMINTYDITGNGGGGVNEVRCCCSGDWQPWTPYVTQMSIHNITWDLFVTISLIFLISIDIERLSLIFNTFDIILYVGPLYTFQYLIVVPWVFVTLPTVDTISELLLSHFY